MEACLRLIFIHFYYFIIHFDAFVLKTIEMPLSKNLHVMATFGLFSAEFWWLCRFIGGPHLAAFTERTLSARELAGAGR